MFLQASPGKRNDPDTPMPVGSPAKSMFGMTPYGPLLHERERKRSSSSRLSGNRSGTPVAAPSGLTPLDNIGEMPAPAAKPSDGTHNVE